MAQLTSAGRCQLSGPAGRCRSRCAAHLVQWQHNGEASIPPTRRPAPCAPGPAEPWGDGNQQQFIAAAPGSVGLQIHRQSRHELWLAGGVGRGRNVTGPLNVWRGSMCPGWRRGGHQKLADQQEKAKHGAPSKFAKQNSAWSPRHRSAAHCRFRRGLDDPQGAGQGIGQSLLAAAEFRSANARRFQP